MTSSIAAWLVAPGNTKDDGENVADYATPSRVVAQRAVMIAKAIIKQVSKEDE